LENAKNSSPIVRLQCLQCNLLLEQDMMGATRYWREGDDWRRAEFSDPEAELNLPCTGLAVRLAELYEGTGLPEV
jgi:hypothetical protein